MLVMMMLTMMMTMMLKMVMIMIMTEKFLNIALLSYSLTDYKTQNLEAESFERSGLAVGFGLTSKRIGLPKLNNNLITNKAMTVEEADQPAARNASSQPRPTKYQSSFTMLPRHRFSDRSTDLLAFGNSYNQGTSENYQLPPIVNDEDYSIGKATTRNTLQFQPRKQQRKRLQLLGHQVPSSLMIQNSPKQPKTPEKPLNITVRVGCTYINFQKGQRKSQRLFLPCPTLHCRA